MSDFQGRSYSECGNSKSEYLMLSSSYAIENQSPPWRDRGACMQSECDLFIHGWKENPMFKD